MDLKELQQQRFADTRELPEPVYELVVRSLYDDLKTLAVGTVSIALAPLIAFHRVGDPVQIWFSVIFALLGGMRLIDATLFRRATSRPGFTQQLRTWEMRYVVLGAAYVGALGMWCMISIARTSDQLVHEIAVIVTISYLTGIMGRNFSSDKVVLSQTVCAGAPLILGAILFGNFYDLVLGLFLWPMFFSIWLMSRKLRGMLFNAVLTAMNTRSLPTGST